MNRSTDCDDCGLTLEPERDDGLAYCPECELYADVRAYRELMQRKLKSAERTPTPATESINRAM